MERKAKEHSLGAKEQERRTQGPGWLHGKGQDLVGGHSPRKAKFCPFVLILEQPGQESTNHFHSEELPRSRFSLDESDTGGLNVPGFLGHPAAGAGDREDPGAENTRERDPVIRASGKTRHVTEGQQGFHALSRPERTPAGWTSPGTPGPRSPDTLRLVQSRSSGTVCHPAPLIL